MRAEKPWWSLSTDRLADLGSTRKAGELSAVLFFLCGLLVATTAPVMPTAPREHVRLLVVVGLVAMLSGVVVVLLPWGRWPRSATLVLVPLAFALIAMHNIASGGDGYRYPVFFFVVATWVGLMHPSGTTLAVTPGMVIAYLVPAYVLATVPVTASSLAYAVPVFVLVGECSSFVAERMRATELRLSSSEHRLRALVRNASDVITVIGADGVIHWESPAVTQVLGYDNNERVGTQGFDYIHPDFIDATTATLTALLANPGGSRSMEMQVRHRDGSWRWCEAHAQNLLDEPSVRGLVVNFADITARHEQLAALADSEASFRLLFSANPQPMWLYDAHTLDFLEVNDAAVRHYGYAREQFLAMRVSDIRPPQDVDRFLQSVHDHHGDEDARRTGGWRHLLADGRMIDVDVTAHRLEFGGREAVLVAIQDVTDRNALEVQLRHQAFHDSLTGLSNRALFADRVEHALGRRTAISAPVVLLLDIDRFKDINDSMGHAMGDEMLVQVAKRLQDAVRLGDTVARLGGDEFAIVVEDCDVEAATVHAGRVLEAVSAPIMLGGKNVSVTASVGIAVAEPGVSSGEVLRNADMAMYRAKSAGGDRYTVFEHGMHHAALRRMELTASLRDAIDGEQFVLHYQPIFDAEGAVVAREALVRWLHPQDGLLPPMDFIPALEDSGLIVALGEWVLHRACLDATAWPDDVDVSVNLSSRQLADDDIVTHVCNALSMTGLPATRLTLEITESVLMEQGEPAVHRMTELRALGVRFAIDDFGTGYSSLAYLRTFPVDELKIDKSFVASIGEESDDRTGVPLVATIVQLARSLSLTVVAEGVETAAQAEVLTDLGCDRLQGYHLGRPQPLVDPKQATYLSTAQSA